MKISLRLPQATRSRFKNKKPQLLLLIIFQLLAIPLFAQRDDSKIAGKFHIDAGSESLLILRWGDDLPHYSSGSAVCQNNRYHKVTAMNQTYDYKNDPNPGVFQIEIGPSRTVNVQVTYEWGSTATGCFAGWADAYLGYTTAKIKAPQNLTGAFNNSPNYSVTLNWDKGTALSDGNTQYRIKRNNVVIATISGNQQTYEDLNITPGGNYTYTVQTIVGPAAPSDWTKDESVASNSVTVSPPAHPLTATTDQTGKIKLTWPLLNTIKGIESVIIYRNGQELIDLSKTTKTYSDADIIPGVFYTYSLGLTSDGTTPIDVNDWRSSTATGRSLPNGKLSGYIKGKTNAGVPGVVVTASSKIALSNAEAGQPDKFYTYSGITDADGYYEITDVFYSDKAEYLLKPEMPGYTKKRFDPETLVRKITIDDSNIKNINFTDTASLSISGRIYFSALKDANDNLINLPLEGAEIWLNGSDSNVRSKGDGSYSVTVINGGTHTLEARFKHHAIRPDASSGTTKTIVMTTPVSNVDFVDYQKDTLQVRVAASCNAPIGEWVAINLNSKKTGAKADGSPLIFNQIYKIRSNDLSSNPQPGQTEPGVLSLLFPAAEFQVEVSTVMEKLAPNPNKTEYFLENYGKVDVNLALRDTLDQITKREVTKTIPADTIFRPDGTIDKITPTTTTVTIVSDTTKLAKKPEVNFIYRKDIRLLVNNGNPVFTDSVFFKRPAKYRFLATQNDKYLASIKIQEFYEYDNVSYGCSLDSGTVFIYDGVGDKEDRQELKLDSTGVLKYQIKVGKPVLEYPYEKTFQIVGKVDGRQTSMIIPVTVQGERPRNATFVTKTPEIPLFVLHDPPGDKSFATISKGTTITSSQTTQYNIGGGGGVFLDSKIGAGITLPFIGSTGAAFHIQAEVEAGADKSSSSTTNYTVTFTEDFSTSSEETLVGNDGDVYVGSSMNMVYALTDMLYYDALKQDMKRDTSFAADYTGFNTTFLYTERHIKNTLIPQLKTLYSLSKSKFDNAQRAIETGNQTISKDAFEQLNREQLENKANIEAWQFALNNNEKIRNEAKPRVLPQGIPGVVNGNISFSAGAIYDNSITLDTLNSSFSELSIYVNSEVRAGIYNANGDFRETDIGGLLTLRHNKANSTEKGTNVSRTVSYHLEDNDIGDFYSVALAEDRISLTPVFRIVSGSSSCPHEDNTQYRHLPAIAVTGTSEQRNVPADQSAKFEINISNQSESDETVEYALKLDPLSNPDGARVMVGGRDITNGVATYMIPTGKSFKLPVEISKGPLTSTHKDLAITIFSTCDNTLDDIDENNIAKPQIKLSAYFQNRCSEIDLFNPGSNWLVNQSNNNKLFVAFSKYDGSAASPLTSVGLQYRKLNTDFDNTQWLTVTTVPKSALVDKYYSYAFDVSGLPDGNYEIRAIAICQGVDVNYSPVYAGKIDRKSAVNFGLPSPQNGILTQADIIGVGFNKDIIYGDNSNPILVSLIRKDTGKEIAARIIGDGRNIEIRTIPENAINDYENIELQALLRNLRDMNGNPMDSIVWNFVVNRSPVHWSPVNMTINAIENQQASFNVKLLNKSAVQQSFTLTKYPQWLSPLVKTGSIVPFGELNIDFSINKNLNTGTYIDTVVASIDNREQFLYVTVNVLRTPPNWTVNPSLYKYNMGITAQFSVNQTDTLVSKDIRDKIAVFSGEECRGVAQIEYDQNSGKYIAYITAYGNNAAGEQLTFRLWDTYPGIEYQAAERIEFISNAAPGNLANPLIFHPEGIYQRIPLQKGWNWISVNVMNGDMSLKKVLNSLKSTPGDVIKTINNNNTYSQFSSKMGWVGNLDSIKIYSGYMLYVTKADTLRLLGNFIATAPKIRLTKGWNWVGYPMAVNMDIKEYFKNFGPTEGLKVVSQEEFAQYNASTGTWNGSLKYLRPGKGYRIFSDHEGFEIPVIPYDPVRESEPGSPALAPVNDPNAPIIVNNPSTVINSSVYNDVTVNTVNHENNMSVTSVINQGGITMNNSTSVNRYETHIYIANKLVNIVNQTPLPDGSAVGLLPINGDKTDDGKPVTIKVYDKEEKKEYEAKIEQVITQEDEQIKGTIESPVVLVLEGLADVIVSNHLEVDQVNKEEEFIYQIKVTNTGPDLAVNVLLSDTLGTAFEYIGSDNPITFDPAKRTLQLRIPQLKSAEEQVLNIRLKANKVGALTIGKGEVTLNNDNQPANNHILPLPLNIIDKRANLAKILIPSLFTPNGDGVNDLFEIVGLKEFYVTNSLVVYNKSYNEVYRKQNYQNDWDGGSLPMGSYGYILRASDKDNKEVVYKGFITIVYQ